MGYDVQRFSNEVDDEFICSICSGVFESPLQLLSCEHIFCKTCITKWLIEHESCPIDRSYANHENLIKIPRIVQNLLMHLQIKCDNEDLGCTEILKLEDLDKHRMICSFNIGTPVLCSWGCGTLLLNDKQKHDHNCADEVLLTMDNSEALLRKIEVGILQQKLKILELKTIFQMIQSTLHCRGEALRQVNEQFETGELIKWGQSLPRATITHWVTLIFTAEPLLLNSTKIALRDAGCTAYFLDKLVNNSYETNWPIGFETSIQRRANRSLYKSLNFRRIPDKQIVILFKFDNQFIEDYLVKEPGIVMNFVCGVEDKVEELTLEELTLEELTLEELTND